MIALLATLWFFFGFIGACVKLGRGGQPDGPAAFAIMLALGPFSFLL